MKVSIAMATYNGANYVGEQLDSLASQEQLPDELIVSDDGSTDDTLKILRSFQARSPFTVEVYCNKKQLGYAKNFERAMRLCSADIIFLCDQDDVWFPEKIRRVVGEFERSELTFVVINDQIIASEALCSSGVTTLENILSIGMPASAFRTGCCTAMARCWAEVVFPIPANSSHDGWINGLTELLGARRIVAEPLQYYRRHGSNASNWLVSETRRVSILDVIRLHRLKDASDGWKKEIGIKHAYLERLRERAEVLRSIGLESAAKNAILQVQQEIGALEERTKVVEVPRWRRGPALLQFLLNGGYGHFAGWKSAAKDLIR